MGIGLIVAAAAIFINAQIGYKQASDSYQKIEKQYISDQDASGVPIIDFDALAQTNPEIVGWIYAPGTNINYPVVQTNNNSNTSTRCLTVRLTRPVPFSWIVMTPRREWLTSRPRSTDTI